mgnify:CR=1 FL=1
MHPTAVVRPGVAVNVPENRVHPLVPQIPDPVVVVPNPVVAVLPVIDSVKETATWFICELLNLP